MPAETSPGAAVEVESESLSTEISTLPKEVTGKEVPPGSRRRLAWSVLGEYAIYIIVGAMLAIALWVNLDVAYFGGGTELLQRFAADGEFILAASAVLLFAFEIRKERRAPR